MSKIAELPKSSTSHLPQAQKAAQPFFRKDGEGSFFAKEAPKTDFFFNKTPIQAKLNIGSPGDKYEQEADTMAEKVVQRMGIMDSRLGIGDSGFGSPVAQRKCAACEKEDKLQKKEEEDFSEHGLDMAPVPVFDTAEAPAASQISLKPSAQVQLQDDPEPTVAERNQVCYEGGTAQPVPSAREPELHPTYERWLRSFTGMTTFTANDTAPGQTARNRFQVLGAEDTPAARIGAASEGKETDHAPLTGGGRNGEEFIDHPTNQWVVNCLPANLRATAYQLPSDCADIAVILRHVWLSAHRRTETIGTDLTLGDATGAANQTRALGLINDISSGNVAQMVNPYADSQGNPIKNFTSLQSMLHPGDVLVWEHRETNAPARGQAASSHRTGGHTQTIHHIARSGGSVTAIQVLQGNLPIFSDAATAIMQHRGSANTDPNSAEGHRLRDLPARRIEADNAVSVSNIVRPDNGQTIWGSLDGGNEFTILVAAGPPKAARRPATAAGAGGTRSILDWRSSIASARLATISGVLESMLQEARSIREGGTAVAVADMQTLGARMGEKLLALLQRNVGQLMQKRDEFIAVTDALRDDSNSPTTVTPLFDAFKTAFIAAAVPATASVESRRIYEDSSSTGQFLQPFASQIVFFSEGIARAANFGQARTFVEQQGAALWAVAQNRAQASTGADNDDRPLYWTRLRMQEEIRQFAGRFGIRQTQRQQLVELFERTSRGMDAVSFASVTGSQKRILISGFNPFGLEGSATGTENNGSVTDSNPSGAAVLGLNGRTVSSGRFSALVQGVIFPVRYEDFDEGMIEGFFSPFLTSTPPVSMIMTISQGGGSFEVERWAGRNRSTDAGLPDNAGAWGGGTEAAPVAPRGIAAGGEFLETGLPHQEMDDVPGVGLDSTRSPESGIGPSVAGSGGGFLSNEIFYRVRLLQVNTGGNAEHIPAGHLHVPTEDEMTRAAIQSRITTIIEAALPTLSVS